MQPVIRLIVDVLAFTGAGSFGLTIEPLGRIKFNGRKQPPFVGMSDPVKTRSAKQAAERDPDGTQLNGPLTSLLVLLKSNVI